MWIRILPVSALTLDSCSNGVSPLSVASSCQVAHIKDYLPKACPHGDSVILDSEVLVCVCVVWCGVVCVVWCGVVCVVCVVCVVWCVVWCGVYYF